MLLFTPMIAGISNKRWQWLPLGEWRHALALVTYDISWHRAYVAGLTPLLWQNWCNFPHSHVIMHYVDVADVMLRINGLDSHVSRVIEQVMAKLCVKYWQHNKTTSLVYDLLAQKVTVRSSSELPPPDDALTVSRDNCIDEYPENERLLTSCDTTLITTILNMTGSNIRSDSIGTLFWENRQHLKRTCV